MDSGPCELSLAEIRNFMLKNNCKVTNHALVKHFRAFLTNKETQEEARKLFKSYVNTLASIKNEGDEKYLILRKKYINDCPTEDALNASIPMSPGSRSLTAVPSDSEGSPFKLPPPYRPPPEVPELSNPSSYQGSPRGSIALSRKNSSDTGRSGSEFSFGSEVMSADQRKIGSMLVRSESSDSRKFPEVSRKASVELYRFEGQDEPAPAIPPRKRASVDQFSLKQVSLEEKFPEQVQTVPLDATEADRELNKENVQELPVVDDISSKNSITASAEQQEENKLSVKEKMLKFNRFASEEEAKIPSPLGKKKPEKSADDTLNSDNLPQHPKAKEWLIAAANANYQELAKLSTDHPNLVKLQDLSTGYTALHWAAKHGNEDVVKLVAGTLKADVNARTNGGYTALHIAMQFGRNDIFELLCNVYKADRDLLDWSGKKPLEYQKQMTSVSASTYSSEYDPMFIVNERFHSLPSKKILSPLSRGGTFMRKKSRRQRPSTATGVELQRTHSMLTVITPEHLSLATNASPVDATDALTSNSNDNRSSFFAGPADAMSLISGSVGNLRRTDKTNQSFFRRKKTQH